ncbi:MAG: hypothetical protein HUJ25_07930 [Crocinitomicaceae bacterium]|nr:hypothetical protein [Crocinitomicaceae bacterium]
MVNRLAHIFGILTFVLVFTSCDIINISTGSEGSGTKKSEGGENYESYKTLKIPYGHIPPAGKCKIWIPGKPPGRQAAPTSCSEAKRNVPANAWVINRKPGNNSLLEVHKCGNVPGKIVSKETYIIDNE